MRIWRQEDKLMENLRFIRERIKSCISCSEDQCPFIKERLDQHVLSHHSATSRASISNHRVRSKPSLQLGKISPVRSRISFVASDQETSTADLNNSNRSLDRGFKEMLRAEVLDWSKDLPVYRNPNFENLKQNVLNELIEKLDELISDVDNDVRDIKIKDEIDNFVDSLPTYTEEQGGNVPKNNLKENLLNRINNLKNENFETVPKRLSFSNQTSDTKQNGKTRAKDMSTSTSEVLSDNGKRTSTIVPLNIDDANTSQTKKIADAEAQHSLTATPHYNNIFKPKTKPNVNSNKDLFKQQIEEWFDPILDRYDENESVVSKSDFVNNLFDNLKPSLGKNVNSTNYKLTLKAKIFDFVDDLPFARLNSDRAYMNSLAEDLANRLLCVKINTDNFKQTYYSDACLHECAMEVMGLNLEKELSLKSAVYEIIFDQLHELKLYRSDIIYQITNLFYEKMLTATNFGPGPKVEVFRLLKNSTDLCDTDIITTINSIVKQLKRINIVSTNDKKSRNSINPGSEMHVLPDAFSIYQSEHTLHELQSYSATSNASRRSSILKKDNNNLNSAEKSYTENISNIIKNWINSIPKSFKKTDKQLKDAVYNSLANDILDQIKIEQIAPETSIEKKKYITFFILRWLNKIEYFKDLNDAKPYVVLLIEKIEGIPEPQLVQYDSKNSLIADESLQTTNNLETEITQWLQEQPSNILYVLDQNKRSKIIQKFSQNIRELLFKNHATNEITKEIVKWISKLIKPEEKSKINNLAEGLKWKIINRHKRDTQITFHKVKGNVSCCDAIVTVSPAFDEVLREIIKIYLEYYFYEDNPIARDAFGYLFKTELQKLRTPSRKQAYDNFIQNIQHEDFLQDRLKKELQYTSIVSDWLMTVPVSDFFNSIENKSRTDKVDKIVKLICDSDETGAHFTDNIYEKIVNELPIQPNYKADMERAIQELSSRIASARPLQRCCDYAYQISSSDSSGIQEQNLSDFVEEYVRTNSNELTANELKFNALTSRIEKEIEKTFNEDNSLNECKKVTNTMTPGHEALENFRYKLGCIKEVSNWLKNLPLQPITDKAVLDKIVKAINILVEEISEKFITKDPDSLHNNTELAKFIANWILELPLLSHENIDMPTATQQLINRVGRVNRNNDESKNTIQSKQIDNSGFICEPPHACCNKSSSNKRKKYDPASVIVETIEKWCNDLPVKAENEITTKVVKDNIARKIYQTLTEINRISDYYNNNLLYQRALSDELDRHLANLPQNENLKNKKEKLKKQLIQVILENKNKIKEKDSADTYTRQLKKMVEMSFPYPIQTQQNSKNHRFEIYKDRLVEIFILDNFDHSDNEMKMNCEKKINDDIKKYFQQDQRQNIKQITKNEVNNQLYSALFQVPTPKNNSMVEEVENIKTKCEIDNWFKTLPLRAANNDKDLLEWDEILTMLAKRLHEMEKAEQNPNEKMHKEITKWLLRLPLLPGQEQNIDYFADDLQAKLKSTETNRVCHVTLNNNTIKSDEMKGILGTSQVAGPSNEGIAWNSPLNSMLPACCQATSLQQKKPAELILEIVESWCKQLPLPANTQQEIENVNLIKGNLIIKVVIKITELNLNPETFNDDQLYDALLTDELENLLSSLPTCCEFIQNKNLLKNNLVAAIKSVKSLIKEDNSRYEYKQELKTTIERVLNKPSDQSTKQVAIFHTLRDEIIDNFIEYSFNEGNIEKQQLHKKVIRNNVANCFENNKDNTLLSQEDPLIKGNQLICELFKVPSPAKSVIIDEVQEIRLKTEIANFFNRIPCDLSETELKNQIKSTLAKRLNDLEKVGYTNDNKIKIKTEIMKCLEKLEANIDNDVIDKFIEDLEKTETVRRVSVSKNNNDLEGSRSVPSSSQKFFEIPQYSSNESTRENYQSPVLCQSKGHESQWPSLLSATPLPRDLKYQDASKMTELNQNFQNVENSMQGKGVCCNLDQSEISYQSFQRDMPLSSSIIRNDPAVATMPKYPSNTSHVISNQECIKTEVGTGNIQCPQQKRMLGSSNSNCSHLSEKSQCQQMPKNALIDQSQQASLTKPKINYQQPRLLPKRFECTSEQSVGSVTNCRSPRQQPSPHTPLTFKEYPRNQTSIPEDIRIQQGSSTPFPLNFPQRRASVINNNGRPCRRPSITILGHDERTLNSHNSRTLQQPESEDGAALGDEEDFCLCERRKQRVCKGNASCPTQQKFCRICNGFKPNYCGPSPYRYPGFYYY